MILFFNQLEFSDGKLNDKERAAQRNNIAYAWCVSEFRANYIRYTAAI